MTGKVRCDQFARGLARWENEGGALDCIRDQEIAEVVWRKQFARLVRAMDVSKRRRRRRSKIR